MPDPDKSLLERLAEFLTPQPTSATERRQELIETLRAAQRVLLMQMPFP
jgi:magnesium and cobalt transporter